uniref:Uncharacterized protein n=1 Tax=Nitrosopumivirus cobalaminus TaxID=3158414 RepID=A0AAU7N452_9VIRU
MVDTKVTPKDNTVDENQRHKPVHTEFLNELISYQDCIDAINLINIRITQFTKKMK